jgi:hypothetical protein
VPDGGLVCGAGVSESLNQQGSGKQFWGFLLLSLIVKALDFRFLFAYTAYESEVPIEG